MSRDSSFSGSLTANFRLTPQQVAVFMEMVASSELEHSFRVEAETGSLIGTGSENTVWYDYRPRGYRWSEHRDRRHEAGMRMDFDAFLAHLISQPEFAGLDFTGEFDVITDDDPFPKIRRVTVADGQVTVSTATITFGDGEVVEPPQVPAL